MNDRQPDPFDEMMRRSLADEAARVEPSDGLHEIRARVRAENRQARSRPWRLTAAGAVLGTATAVGAFTLLVGDRPAGDPELAGPDAPTISDDTVRSATPTTTPPAKRPATPAPPPTAPQSTAPQPTAPQSPTATSSRSPVEPPAPPRPTATGTPEKPAATAVPVYWLGKTVGNDQGAGFRLYRTFSRIDGRPALEAVRLMTKRTAGDPDYQSPWSGASVNSVTRADGLVTVDFTTLPSRTLEPAVAEIAVQQLVYTVQGAMGDSLEPVRITERGRAAPALFGVVDTANPTSRAQAADVQALVWIISPVDQAVAPAPITITGVAAAFEAQVNWQATNLRTNATVKGFTTAREGQKFSPFTFAPRLAPGQWRVEAYLISPEDGRITDTDSKTITVR